MLARAVEMIGSNETVGKVIKSRISFAPRRDLGAPGGPPATYLADAPFFIKFLYLGNALQNITELRRKVLIKSLNDETAFIWYQTL